MGGIQYVIFQGSLQWFLEKEKGIKIIYFYFSSERHVRFLGMPCSFSEFILFLFILFYFYLNSMNLKALISVYFLVKITWLYVYCKFIKYTIFVSKFTFQPNIYTYIYNFSAQLLTSLM